MLANLYTDIYKLPSQVHRGTSTEGMEVAIKMIYPNLRKDLASDFAVFR
jgi:predicted unusual protein kinase regulating ubiquinone biosynthesis (AarF/ABC1/UbiB family)